MKIGKYIALAAASTLALAGCSSNSGASSETSNSGSADTTNNSGLDPIQVTTSFYPLTYLVEQVGGDRVSIQDLTPPGGDAHGAELSPREIADMEKSQALFYIATLSSSVDDAAATVNVDHVVELGAHADLLPPDDLAMSNAGSASATDDHDHEAEATDDHDHEAEAADEHDHEAEATDDHDHEAEATDAAASTAVDEHAGHDHGSTDPHFWTDPARMALVVPTVVDTLSEIDPNSADQFKQEGDRLVAELTSLEGDFQAALAPDRCETQSFVITHEAFSYLAHELNLTQISIAGVDPETEPSPARILEVANIMKDSGTSTIFATSDSEKATAESLATETNSTVEVLNPVASKPENGDYISAMRDNLAQLETAMSCS